MKANIIHGWMSKGKRISVWHSPYAFISCYPWETISILLRKKKNGFNRSKVYGISGAKLYKAQIIITLQPNIEKNLKKEI